MATTNNVSFYKYLESNVPADGTCVPGSLIATEEGNLYVVNTSSNKVKISDLIFVTSLPTTGLPNKVYILDENDTVTSNYYDTTYGWIKINQNEQILVQSTAPTSTYTIWLDNSSLTKPIMKWYNGTSWIALTGSDNSKMDKITNPVINDLLGMDNTGNAIDSGILSTNVVTLNGTQTLNNKTFVDTTTLIENGTDNTKKFILDGSNISTGTTRTLTIPDKNGTIAMISDIPTNIVPDATTSSTGIIQLSGDLSGSATSPVVHGIQSIPIDNTNLGNGRTFIYNSSTKTIQWGSLNVAGVIGSTSIIQPNGIPFSIAQGQEIIINHPAVSNYNIMIQILEEIQGSSISDVSNNFNNPINYTQYDNNTTIGNGTLSLIGGGNDANTKLLLHMDNNFTDSSASNITCTPSSVGFSNSIYKFGGYSAYFNGGYLVSVVSLVGYPSYTLDFDVYMTGNTGGYTFFTANSAGAISGVSTTTSFGYYNGAFVIIGNGSGISNLCNYSLNINTWYHVAYEYDGTNTYIYVDGTLIFTGAGTYIQSYLCELGLDYYSRYPLYGYLDEFRVSNKIRWTSNFTPQTLAYGTYPTSTLSIVNSKIGFALSNVSEINSISSTVSTPTNSSIKWLVSFDNRQNWLSYNATTGFAIQSANSSLLTSSSFNTSNIYSDFETYFTNLTMTKLTSDLSALSISPTQLDFAWLLNTTNTNVTPSINVITINYNTLSHYELAIGGKYNSNYADYGVKVCVSNTTSTIKKISSGAANIIPNVVIGS
ncbi:LamG-like jellyroll fold domain-containing protein [Clostridium sp.]|uniref:LamG-like jellyroll fold domain-containing protein n=1 Tax=Clostridium sp. TaxID=1506 RepID=UPI0026163B30|nr:LamG-like jellyroll fold domain-containing protein [Clostridium sp.]